MGELFLSGSYHPHGGSLGQAATPTRRPRVPQQAHLPLANCQEMAVHVESLCRATRRLRKHLLKASTALDTLSAYTEGWTDEPIFRCRCRR